MSSTEDSNSNNSLDGSVEETKKSESNELPNQSFDTTSSFLNDLSPATDSSPQALKEETIQFGKKENSQDLPNSSFGTDEAEGEGEWSLLSGKVSTWLKENNFQIKGLRRPLFILVAVLASILTLQVYGSILEAISHVPLAPRLFQLAGLLWIIYFSVTSLVRSQDRQELFAGLVQRWKTFSGNDES